MKLIVGLGNPGKEYAHTRHNLGWMVLDALAKRDEVEWSAFRKSPVVCYKWSPEILMAKPQTFMNESGKAVSSLFNFYKLQPQDLIVVHDDLDLPFGSLRISQGASAGGHKGVQSIIDAIGSQQFTRLRLGIGSDKRGRIPTEKFVLLPFSLFERIKLKSVVSHASQALDCLCKESLDTCMTKFN